MMQQRVHTMRGPIAHPWKKHAAVRKHWKQLRPERKSIMEWIIVIGLIAVIAFPIWMIVYWIPRCDAIGVQKAKEREAREAAIKP
jgi:hypothetical protein